MFSFLLDQQEVWLDKYDEDHALTPNMTVALDTRIFKPKVVDPQQRRNTSHKVKEESTTGEPGNQAVTEDLVNETFDTDTSHKCCVCRGMGMFALNSSESDMNMEKYKTKSVGNGDQADKQSEDSGVGVTNMMKVRPTDRDAGKLCQQCDAMQCYSCNGSICGVFEREGNRLSKATQIETNTSNKATQIQTVPRISVKKSAGTQTDRDVMVFSERDHEKSETSETHKDSSQQTDINMNMFTVLTPNYSVHSTTSVGQSPKKGKTTSIGQSPKKGKRSRKKSRQTSFTPPKSDVIKEGTLVLESFIEYLRHRQESDPLDLVLSDSANICRVTLQLLSRELALPGGQGFPFHLIKDYLDQLKNPPAEMDNGDWGISWEYNVFLNTISRWLGQEFHQFESYIGKRLEKFKQDHIDCIDNLPPAETVIDQMFPKCMKELVFNWTNGESLGQPEFDHEYGSPQKKSRRCLEEETDMVYPIAQHILEFANHALVSGVAHVVYSRLRHTNY